MQFARVADPNLCILLEIWLEVGKSTTTASDMSIAAPRTCVRGL